ncbi:unnamed protein product [marine sediment metagenome]|uniref:Uncharacterized protein n=1 Tax=marine sediment metagenome TaxID=412755 RepID=X1RD51_9ZZZZ
MPEERTLKITCDECGYSKIVPHSSLAYEEAKTCPSCGKGKMWWVPPAEEARRREVRMPEGERRISPALIIIPIGLGLGVATIAGLYALTQAVPPEEEGIELQPGGNAVKWTRGPTHVEDALADIIDYVTLFLVLRETDQVWIQITADIWDTWAIPRDQICGIYVDRACTVTGFVWA